MHTWYKIAKQETDSKSSSCVAIFRKQNKNIEILLVKRENNPAKGEWAFPGGHVEGRETFLQAAKREIKEEIDLTLESNQLIKVEDSKEHCLFAYFDDDNQTAKAMTDAAEVKWYALNDIPDLAFDNNQQISSSLAKLLEWSLGNNPVRKASCTRQIK